MIFKTLRDKNFHNECSHLKQKTPDNSVAEGIQVLISNRHIPHPQGCSAVFQSSVEFLDLALGFADWEFHVLVSEISPVNSWRCRPLFCLMIEFLVLCPAAWLW